ncbi:MAG: asparaginase [Rhodospirillaceae bacterium]|nr:asparaginase [Rhodospirillaceae bacterium]
MSNPVLVEVTRGDGVESRHRGSIAVFDKSGKSIAAWGDITRPVLPRSAVKPLQALPLIETGAAEKFAISDAELALACSSHNSEPEHVDQIAAWLRRIGLSEANLECGPHRPMDEQASDALVRNGIQPTRLHNNCSGKHAGFLTTAVHLNEPTAGYASAGHPVQARLRRTLEEMGDCDLSAAPEGIDGCGIPVIAMPLSAIALALARMADPSGLDPARAIAARRIVAAMTTHPHLIAGRHRFDTTVMQAARGAIAVKTGAEGVHAAILPKLGLGVALKIDDGTRRAAEVTMAGVLRHLGALDDYMTGKLKETLEPGILNAAGEPVGGIRMAKGWV